MALGARLSLVLATGLTFSNTGGASMKTFLVVNPHSASGQTGKRWAELSAEIGKGLGEFGHGFTEKPMDAARLAREALHQGYECIAAVGGDGTINEVVNGFFENGRAINPQAALGLIARGTGGDFRRSFGWSVDLSSAVERLRTDQTQPFDVGQVEFLDHDGKPTTRYFANIASFGFTALAAKKVNESSKRLGARFTYMMGAVRAFLDHKDHRVRFVVDDRPAEEVAIFTVAVANCQFFGGGVRVAPDANPSDGTFHVTIWTGYGLSDFAFRQGGLYSGAHVKWKGTRTLQCRQIQAEPVTPGTEVLVEVDGETPGRLPCRMQILPSAIRLKI